MPGKKSNMMSLLIDHSIHKDLKTLRPNCRKFPAIQFSRLYILGLLYSDFYSSFKPKNGLRDHPYILSPKRPGGWGQKSGSFC